MRKRAVGVSRVVALGVMLLFVLCAGCATVNVKPMPQDNAVVLTLLQKAQLRSADFMERYTRQFKDAQSLERLVKDKRATPGQVEVYKVKRQLLIKAEPLVKGFDKLVKDGVIPGTDAESSIDSVLNDLVAAGGV